MINFTAENIAIIIHNAGCCMGNKYVAYITALYYGDTERAEKLMIEIENIEMLRFALKCHDPDNLECLTNELAERAYSSLIEAIGCVCGDCSESQGTSEAYKKVQTVYLQPQITDPIAAPPVVLPQQGNPLNF